jgi:RNA polymerase sigma-70 factor, ECF subfamily
MARTRIRDRKSCKPQFLFEQPDQDQDRRRTDAELDEKIEATIADPADEPEVALQEKDRGELLRRALTRLSPEHRQIIDLVYYHEKSVDEVAHILDVPAATVKTRMFYARKKLADWSTGRRRTEQ